MSIRIITPSDVDFLDGVRLIDFEEGWNKNMLLSAFNGGRFFGLISEEDGKSVGFITFSHGLDGITDIESVYVLPDYRRRKIANGLMEKFLSDEKSRGTVRVFLEVKRQNTPAIALYNGFGFNKISERKKYYPDGSDALIMVKEL